MHCKNNILFIETDLTKKEIPVKMNELKKFVDKKITQIDLDAVKIIDSAGVAFLDELQQKFSTTELINLSPEIERTYKIFNSLNLPKPQQSIKENFFVNIGERLLEFWQTTKKAVYLLADIFFWSFVGIVDRKGHRKGSVISQSLLIGVDALGIIGLLSFILGLILALQSAAQLRQFGANIFVADLMAVSMVTEMGPLLTSIILAGRSGSAIASEIATMKVTEELDALKMMAINPIRYVVVPKFHAMTLCIPLLVIMATLIGILGGLIIAITYLDISVVAFVNRIFDVITFKDAAVGIGKSFFFAWTIVIIGSYYGFTASGGAEGVGKVTTKSVVASIFWIIILDALNSLIFYF